jgi:hypothetical protein
MVSFDVRRSLGTITKIAVTLVVLLAPFSASAQTAAAPAPDVCAQSVPPDSGPSPRIMDSRVDTALNQARRRINAGNYTGARASVGQLELDRLTPYALAMAEGLLFRIANAERKYDEARRHLVRAIESCGLTAEGIAGAQEAIKRIDARLATDTLCTTVAQPASPPGAEDALQALVAEIDDLRSLRGGNSPDLIEPLTALSSLYAGRADYELALALIEEATQVIAVNHGLHTLEEAQLMRQSIRIERVRGNAEGAWNEEQELLGLIERHPNDARAAPMLQEIACGRRVILARYRAGEHPPEIVLGCYYSNKGVVAFGSAQLVDTRASTAGGSTGCRSGSKRAVIRALRLEISLYEDEARRLLFTCSSGYGADTRCLDANYRPAADRDRVLT